MLGAVRLLGVKANPTQAFGYMMSKLRARMVIELV